MKKLPSFLLVLTLLLGLAAPFGNVFAYVSVKGYTKANGTYVAPYVRSNPNGLKSDNYGWTPSQGIYNPSYGTKGTTWDTPTYITDPNYYEGEALYESHSVPSNINPNTNISASSHLTAAQIDSILNLLLSFSADSSVIKNVAATLRK